MKTLATILAQIEKLQAEAEAMRKQERTAVIQRMREAIAIYSITMEELMEAPKKKKAPVKSDYKPAYVKGETYSDGVNFWRGHARVPKWLLEHAAGRPLEQFRVGAAPVKEKAKGKSKERELARYVKKVRDAAGMNQAQFAQHLGVIPKSVSRWENTGRIDPRCLDLVKQLEAWHKKQSKPEPEAPQEEEHHGYVGQQVNGS